MNLSVRWKIVVLFIVPLIGVFAVLVGYDALETRRWMTDQVEHRMSETAHAYADHFDGRLREAARLTTVTARFVENHPELSSDELYRHLRTILELDPLLYAAAVAFEPYARNPNERFFARYVFRSSDSLRGIDPVATGYDYTADKREYWHTPRTTGQAVWTEPYFDEGAGNILMCSYSEPFYREGDFYGIVSVDIPLESLRDLIDIGMSDDFAMYVITGQGNVVFSPRSDWINRSIHEIIEDHPSEEYANLVAAMTSGETGARRVSDLVESHRSWVFYAPVESARWSFAASIEADKALAAAHDQFYRGLVAMGVALLLAIVGCWYLTQLFVNPVSKLRGAIAELTRGNLNARATRVNNDDIGELADSFNEMADRLARREQALVESEEKHRTLVENLPQRVFYKDGNSVYVSCNDNYARDLGIESDQIVGKTDFDFYPPHEAARYRADDARLMKTGKTEEIEERCVKKDGVFWIHTSKSAVKDERGEVIGILGAFWDVTERKQAEIARQESEAFSRAVIEHSPVGISIRSAGGQLLSANEAWRKIWGLSAQQVEELRQKSAAECRVPPGGKSLGSWESDVVKIYTEGGHLHIPEFHATGFEGCRTRWVSMLYYSINNARGEVDRVVILTSDITERKEAEVALLESDAFNGAVIEHSPLGISVRSRLGKLLTVNAAWQKIWGIPDETVKEYMAAEPKNFAIDDRDGYLGEWITQVRRVYEEGGRLYIPELYLANHRSGEPRWVSQTFYAINDAAGHVDRVVIITNDITEWILAEEALKESEELLRAQFESTPDIVLIVDRDYRIIRINHNPPGSRWAAKELIGHDAISVLPEKHQETVRTKIAQCFCGGEVQDYELQLGEDMWVRARVAPMRRGNTIDQVMITSTDITESRRAQTALQESEDKYRNFVERASEGITIIQDGRLKYVNPSLAVMVGLTVEEMIGEPYSIFANPDEYSDAIDQFDRRMTGDECAHRFSTALRHRDGHRVDVELSGGTIRFEGRPANLIFIRDTTETKRLRELESRAQRLETAGRIAGQVAHDFNNLLAPMVAYPEFIREELSKDHPALAYVSSIEDSAQQIADINQQLLTLGRRGHYNQEPLNLNEVVLHVFKEMEVPPSTLVCETDLDADLMNIMGGRSQIHRVLVNLFQNARDAMQDVGRLAVKSENFYVDDVSIKYCRVPKGEYIKLTVSDNGCGIPAEHTEKVFDPFFTSKATDRKRGSGLGLSVVDAVVKDHKGYIDLYSSIGEGTSIYLYFPITRESSDTRVPEELVGGHESILVVDDDQVQREVSLRLLNKLGYRAETAESGERALELCREKTYDLLILDMVMPPGMDGTETYRQALTLNPSQRAIIVSGFAETDRVAQAQVLGAGAFIRKPLTRAGLAGAVRKELDRSPVPGPT